MHTTNRRRPNPQPQPAPTAKTGESLPAQAASRMSAAFGHSFSSVRVFHDDGASQQAEGLGAQAFAQGSDLFFQKGFYDPHGLEGQRLLAHELTHVVQQDRYGPEASLSARKRSRGGNRDAVTNKTGDGRRASGC